MGDGPLSRFRRRLGGAGSAGLGGEVGFEPQGNPVGNVGTVRRIGSRQVGYEVLERSFIGNPVLI